MWTDERLTARRQNFSLLSYIPIPFNANTAPAREFILDTLQPRERKTNSQPINAPGTYFCTAPLSQLKFKRPPHAKMVILLLFIITFSMRHRVNNDTFTLYGMSIGFFFLNNNICTANQIRLYKRHFNYTFFCLFLIDLSLCVFCRSCSVGLSLDYRFVSLSTMGFRQKQVKSYVFHRFTNTHQT